jgi:glycosyltransferase involved in cell wall biosynthesis
MKVFFNRVPRNEPYGGGNQFLARMSEHLVSNGHEVTYHLHDRPDVIFLMDPRPGDIGYSIQHVGLYKQQFPKTKILHRINECDNRKGTDFMDDLLMSSAALSDEVVFISQWLSDYFVKKGFDKAHHVVYNGCDLDHFSPDTEKLFNPNRPRLVTHHWSDNWLKGFDLYTQIDKYLSDNNDFEFTYVGRYSSDYKPIVTQVVDPLHGKALGDELMKHDIYVTASRWEPCGMHHIEGAASGMPIIYHTDTGGIKELCSRHGEEYTTFDEFLVSLKKITENYSEYLTKIDRSYLDINRCVSEYYDILTDMVSY